MAAINFDEIRTAIADLTDEQRQQLADELNERNGFNAKAYLQKLQAQQTDEAKAQAELKQRFV